MMSPVKKESNENEMIPSDPGLALKKFSGPLVEYLISGLEEQDKWVRIMAADMLGTIGDPKALLYLKPFLVDRDPDIRAVSARAFSLIHSLPSPQSVSPSSDCGHCMIRLIAEEVLTRQKSTNQGLTSFN
jgi:hypothetical protein